MNAHTGSVKPHYRYIFHLALVPLIRIFLGIPSSPSRDAALLVKGISPSPCIIGDENIPRNTPFVLVINHYDHSRLPSWWGVAVVLHAIRARRTAEPRDIHMAMVREWWYPGGVGRLIKQPFTRWAFERIAKTYGAIRLPPVLGDDSFRGEGALPIRHALALTRGEHPQLVGLAPEGHTGEGLALCAPPPGAGLFMLLLTHDKIPCLPAGIFENECNTLTVVFGAPFYVQVPRTLERQMRDRAAAERVMVEIGRLLPERMWGVYRDAVAAKITR